MSESLEQGKRKVRPLRKVMSRVWRHSNKYVATLECGHKETQTEPRGCLFKEMADSVRCTACANEKGKSDG